MIRSGEVEKNLTEMEKYLRVNDISRRFMCVADPEVKKLSLSYNAAVSDEARALHKEAIIVDGLADNLEDYNWHLEEAGASAINVTVPGTKDSAGNAMRSIIDYFAVVNDFSDKLMHIRTVDDIYKAKKEGKVGVIFGAQSCEFVDHNCLDASVEVYANIGLRIMQIAYNHSTFAADGCFSESDAGLTNDGKALIRAMERNGVVLDLSHMGCRSALDCMDYTEKPPIFSHSNPRALFDTPRNITDEMAKKCAGLGGVIGVRCYNVMLWNGKEWPTIEHYLDAVAYWAELVGVEHVAFGVDSILTPGAYPHRDIKQFSKLARSQGDSCFAYHSAAAGRDLFGKFLEGLESLANIPCLIDGLLKRGFSHEEIKKIAGENWIRVYGQWWK
ncbi:membrane dipeptidase [Lachnospiraceae bacterium 45-P1]